MNYQQMTITLPTLTVRETTGPKIITPKEVHTLFEYTAELAQETFNCVTLDSKNFEIDRHTITIGTLNRSLVHPRDLFRIAINDNAASIILSHNHPSGDPTPSPEDIKVTKQLVAAGEIIGIKVLDHVIIGRGRPNHPRDAFLSLRETGLVKFN